MQERTNPQIQPASVRPRASWWRVLLIGLLLYALGIAILGLTGNPNLFPTVVLLGSFVVPAAYVAFFYEHRHLSRLTMPTTLLAFFYGGVLGVFSASLLEPVFIRSLNPVTAFVVGIIEEFVKILGILVIARRRRHDSELDGIVLGVAAGMGFAALESLGYAFTAFLGSGGDLTTTVVITLIRGLFSPLGHGTWTAILAAVLFRESRAGHFRINLKVIGAYLTVVILHGLWDAVPPIIAAVFTAGVDVLVAQAVLGVVGLLILWRHWREGRRLQTAAATADPASPSEF